MSKTLTLLAALLVIIAAFIMLRNHSITPTTPISAVPDPVLQTNTSVVSPITNPVATPAGFLQWREFSSPTHHFKALLPGVPQHVSDTVGDPETKEPKKYDTFASATDNGTAFMISVVTFETPDQVKSIEESLKAAVTDMLERNKNNKLNSMKMGTFHGTPALDFSLNSGELLVEGKVIAHDNAIYILSMLNQKDLFNKQEYDFFINSFNFVGGDKTESKLEKEPTLEVKDSKLDKNSAIDIKDSALEK